MLASPFSAGVGFYAFYAMQPYLLQLYGDPRAYGIAGLAAAMVAGAQIAGGLVVGRVRGLFKRRTDALILGAVLNVALLAGIGLAPSFPIALILLAAWCLTFALQSPFRQAFVNGLIPSEQRATVLSFDNLMGSAGGAVVQPVLGRVADVSGYGASYLVGAVVHALSIPFVLLARREGASSDPVIAGLEPGAPSGAAVEVVE